MKINHKLKKAFFILAISAALSVIIVFSDIGILGIKKGLLISANVIIPSLFPFTVFVLFFIKCNISVKNKFINKIIFTLFGYNFDLFIIFVLSLIGGYPIGAKLISELFKSNKIEQKTANIMLLYCVNAGPAFIVSAIGNGILNSYKIGVILLVAHILSSIIMAIILSKSVSKQKINFKNNGTVISLSEGFVESVADASAAVIQICSYVILFSCLSAFIEYFLSGIPIIEKTTYFLEVTLALTKTKNIIFASFLLGFSGISIWFQIFSIAKSININHYKFILGRIIHGALSSAITYVLIKIFKIKMTVFSNNISYSYKGVFTNLSLSISLIIMLVMLLIYIYSKNSSRKLLDDMV